MAWIGKIISRNSAQITLSDPRPLQAGFGKGSSDLIGFTPITITTEMVGKTVAVFMACEVKNTGQKGRITKEQRDFLTMVLRLNGVAILADSAEDFEAQIGGFIERLKKNEQ